jgi:hypothetical protein
MAIRLAVAVLLAIAWIAPASGAQPPAARPVGAHPAQRIPSEPDFPTGPAIGERLPDFVLPNQRGEKIDFHADRDGRQAAVLFQRSAVW